MKTTIHHLLAMGFATTLLGGVAFAVEPLAEAAATKAAAAEVATDKAAAANEAVRNVIVTRAEAARAISNASLELTAAKKKLSAGDAAAKAANEKAVKDLEAKVAAAKVKKTEADEALKAANEKFKVLRRASYPVIAAKTTAEKALAEKIAAGRSAAAKAAAEKSAAAAAALKKATTDKAAAEKSCKDCVARADANKADKAAADKAAAARKALAAKDAAVKAATRAAAAAKSAADKAAAAKTAADKDLSAKISADKAAVDTLNGSNLYVATVAVDDLRKEKAAAEKAATVKAGIEAKAKSAYAAARAAAGKAAAEKAAAEKTLAAADEKVRAAARKACDAKVAAAKIAAGKAAAAKTALDKAVAETRDARNTVAEKAKAIPPAQDKFAQERRTTLGGLRIIPSSQWTLAKARHLVVRAGFGGTPAEVQKIYEMGLHDAVDHFVEIYRQPVSNIEFDPPRLERSRPWQSRLPNDERQYMTVKYRNPERALQGQMRRWWLQRMAESPRPLQEKMTLFWHDHFAVQYKKRYRTYMLYQQNQLFRTYGTANYAALLRGIVHDPAMISYLDNNVNYKGSGNENLGREILELFSLGEGRGYSEDDLREASRALTGNTYDSGTGQFRFLATRHDEEPKKIFGSTGNWGGDDLVDLILRQPATAGYVSEKLFKFLAHDEPSAETAETMAGLMRYCSYDLRPVLRNLFLSEEFYSAKAMGSHIKGPAELAVGAIRDLGIKDVNYAIVDAAINQMGQYLFEPPNVAGWNEGRTWINAERILVRYNQMAKILEQPNVDLVALLKGDGLDTPRKVVDELARACLVVKPDPATTKALADYLGALPPAAEWEAKRNEINARLRAILVLLMSTPESQLG